MQTLLASLNAALASAGYAADCDHAEEEIYFYDAAGDVCDLAELPPEVRKIVASVDPRAA